MKFDFDKIFNSGSQSKMKIPQRLIEYFNKTIPDGFYYEVQGSNLVLKSYESKQLKFSGFTVELNQHQKDILGENPNPDDILKYSFNSQTILKLKPHKDGYLLVNGKEVRIENIVFNPFQQLKYEKDSLFSEPPKFPPSFDLEIGNGKINKKIKVQRFPNDSLNILYYKSVDNGPIFIEYFINENDKSMTFNYKYNLEYASSLSQIIEILELINGFNNGIFYISQTKIDVNISSRTNKKNDEMKLDFWKRIKYLEGKLKIKFDIKQIIDEKMVSDVEELYYNLRNKKPVKSTVKIKSLDLVETTEDFVSKFVGSEIVFKFLTKKEFNILGCKISLDCLVFVFNTRVTKIEINENNNKTIFLEDCSPEKERFVSSMVFENEMALNKYCLDLNSKIKLFYNAILSNKLFKSEVK